MEVSTGGNVKRGNKDELLSLIQVNILAGGQCISMKTLTDIYRLNGSDKKSRYHVKHIVEEEFKGKFIIMTVEANKPQVILRSIDLHTSGSVFHSSNKKSILSSKEC